MKESELLEYDSNFYYNLNICRKSGVGVRYLVNAHDTICGSMEQMQKYYLKMFKQFIP